MFRLVNLQVGGGKSDSIATSPPLLPSAPNASDSVGRERAYQAHPAVLTEKLPTSRVALNRPLLVSS